MVKRKLIGNKQEILATRAECDNWLNIINTVASKTEAERDAWLQTADAKTILEVVTKATWANSRAIKKIWRLVKNAK
jgi:hypothetical protein